jgi:hypothetical protein
MLIALIVSPVSVKVVYGLVWAVLCFEFVRIRPYEGRKIGYLVSGLFAVLLAIAFVAVWPYLPKPKEEPNLDQTLAKFGDTLSDKIVSRTLKAGSPANTVTTPTARSIILKVPAEVQVDSVNFDDYQDAMIRVKATVSNHGPGIATPLFFQVFPYLRDGSAAMTPNTEDKIFTATFLQKIPRKLLPDRDLGVNHVISTLPVVVGLRSESSKYLIDPLQWLYVVGGIIYSDQTGIHRKGVCSVYVPMNIKLPEAYLSSEDMVRKRWRTCDPPRMKKWELGGN